MKMQATDHCTDTIVQHLPTVLTRWLDTMNVKSDCQTADIDIKIWQMHQTRTRRGPLTGSTKACFSIARALK